MKRSDTQTRRQFESLDRDALSQYQLTELNLLLAAILPGNAFYSSKLGSISLPLSSLDQLAKLPFTTKAQLQGADGLALNRTFPVDQYARFHRTSGTHGHPMIVLDTAEDWNWWLATWQYVLDAAEVTPSDRVLMAFSFGPFIGFWSANDALASRGAMVIPAGGLSSVARLELLRSSRATVVCSTPSYALRLAEVAGENGIDLKSTEVTRIIVAGEPGGSIPSMKGRIESAWGARVVDHSGATEIGPWGYADHEGSGLHVCESQFIAEFLALETGLAAQENELSELVLTTLHRTGSPVIRYRTGDLVRPRWKTKSANRFVLLDGGVLGRADDMLVIRGVNIFPSAVEQIICGFAEVGEYRITARKRGEMDVISVDVEDQLNKPSRIAQELNLRLGLNVDVTNVPLGTLPRFEGKGRRFVDQRSEEISDS